MSKKLKLDKQLIRALSPNEIVFVSGGYGDDDLPTPWDPATTTEIGTRPPPRGGGTGGWVCFTIQLTTQTTQLPRPETVNKTCGSGTAGEACTTGGGETFSCAVC